MKKKCVLFICTFICGAVILGCGCSNVNDKAEKNEGIQTETLKSDGSSLGDKEINEKGSENLETNIKEESVYNNDTENGETDADVENGDKNLNKNAAKTSGMDKESQNQKDGDDIQNATNNQKKNKENKSSKKNKDNKGNKDNKDNKNNGNNSNYSNDEDYIDVEEQNNVAADNQNNVSVDGSSENVDEGYGQDSNGIIELPIIPID